MSRTATAIVAPGSRRPYLKAYGVVALAVVAVTLTRLPFEHLFHGRAPYALYYLPILWAAWYGGVGPTVFAIALSLASAWAFVIPGTEPGYLASIGLFLVASSGIVLLARVLRASQEAQLFLGSVVASSDDAIVTKNLESIIQSWNAGAQRLFGYTAAEVVGRSVTILIPPEHQDEEAHILDRLKRGERIDHFETVRVAKDGRRIEVSLTVSPVCDRFGRIIGASKVARDISERKRAEEERRFAMEDRERLLERERAARNEAEQANRSKDEFVAMVSHELRTPLNAIMGWTQILKRTSNDDETMRRGIEVIERNTLSQAQLISDLLDMSRIISGKLPLDVQDIDLVALSRTAVEAARPAADAKKVALALSVDVPAASTTGDPTRIQQCVWNLLSNAIKFTPSGGRVELRLSRVGSNIQLCVCDTGVGIPPAFLPFVFERFRQAETATGKHTGGLGLGLAIVKQLAELHGGHVRAESGGEGRGSTFTLTLPIRALRTNVARAKDAEPEADALERVRVLVVEDDADNREVLRRLLEQHRAIVGAASSAGEALEMLPSVRPHVLVSDIGLPEVDGYELIQRVRRIDSSVGGAVPAIALTARASAEDRAHALRVGYQAHIAKPVAPGELVAKIASLAAPTMSGR